MTNLQISEKYPPVTELATRKDYSFRGVPDPNPGETTGSAQDSPIALTDQTNLLPFNKIVVVNLSLGLCIVVSSLDSVIVATALPTISKAFDAGAVVSWVPAGFLLTSTSFQPLYGRFSDIFGRKSALFVTMAVFIIGNLIAGFSKSIVQLIIARGISGAGAGENLIYIIFPTKLDGRIFKAGFLACARLS